MKLIDLTARNVTKLRMRCEVVWVVLFLSPHQTPIEIEVKGLGWEAHGIVGKKLNFWYRFTVG